MSTSVFQIPKNTGFTYGAPRVPAINQNSGVNRAKELFGQTVNTIKGAAPANMGTYVMYFLSILFVLFAILMFIHYFITPIWQINPGGPGVIPLPGLSDSKVYWQNVKDEQPINDASGGMSTITSNWSMSLDIFVSQPYGQESSPRFIFTRSPNNPKQVSSIILTDSLPDYNVAMALIPSTNDLIVSALNSNNNEESVIVPNIPIQKPFRIGIIIFDSMMEVYVNGMLYQTKQFSAPTKVVGGFFRATPSTIINNTAKVKNLIVWRRAVTAGEMRYAKPSLAAASEFDPDSMESSAGACPNLQQNAATAVSAAAKSFN